MLNINRKCVQLLLEIAENGALDLTIQDKDGLLAYDLCLDEHTKQLIWDKTKIQKEQKEKKAQEKKVEKFEIVNNQTPTNKTKKKPLKIKTKKNKKMKIKLKK